MRSYEIIHCQDSSKMAQPLLCQAQAKVIRTFKKCPNPPKSRHHPSFKMIFWQTHSFFGQATFLKRHFMIGQWSSCLIWYFSSRKTFTGHPDGLPGKAKLQKFPFSSPACCCSMTEEQHGKHSNGIVKDESTKNPNAAKTAQSLTKFAVEDNNPAEERDSNCNCLPKTNTDSLANTKSVVVETHF